VIPQGTRQRLETLGTELEQKTGAQLAIVTVKSLDDRPIEDYAVDLFKHLGVGSKKENSGILLLLAPNDRKYRIEVGYGIEPVINDARAGDAGRAMVPFFARMILVPQSKSPHGSSRNILPTIAESRSPASRLPVHLQILRAVVVCR
jgi:hypothetical protein